MSRANLTTRRSGFTLVELLVIAPIALLVITGFVALMVTMIGDVLVSRGSNVMTYDIQNALSTIEDDVRLSTEFLTSTGSLPLPQGKNDGTQAFAGSHSELILGEIATDKNPIDPLRRFVHYNTPHACGNDQEYQNRIFFVTVIYYVKNESLWRRTYVPAPSGTLCKTPWQVNTCSPDYSAARCQATDSEVLKDIKSFNIDYFVDPEDTEDVDPSLAGNASTLQITIEGEKIVAGRTINATSTSRVTKLSSLDVNLAPPDPPVVTGTNNGRTAVFSWPGVPTASSYIVKYNVNGGGWTTSSENTAATTFSVPADHGDTVSIEVMARNTTGASAAGTASVQIPTWIDCSLENGWTNYSTSFAGCGYTISKDGVVDIQGLIKDGTRGGSVRLFVLPEAYRPPSVQMFTGMIAYDVNVRLQVEPDGDVYLVDATGGGTPGWLSLSDISFVAASAAYDWTNLSFQNSWSNYGSGWQTLSSTVDGSGRVHIRGLVKDGGSYGMNSPFATLPSGSNPGEHIFLSTRSGPGTAGTSNAYVVQSDGQLLSRGITSGGYLSVQTMFYPSSYTGWTNFATVSGTPTSGQMGSGWVHYGGSYARPAYTKSDDGIVTVKGFIKDGTLSATAAVLPPGYRPSNRLMLSQYASGTTTARVDVTSAGQIIPYSGSASSAWTAINFSFRASN